MRLWLIGISLLLVSSLAHAQQPAQTTDATQPADQSAAKRINPPKVLNNVEAEFSEEARQKGIGGACKISVTVDTKGYPQDIKLVSCSDPSFEKSSLAAAAQYRFEPATNLDGKPVAAIIFIKVEYHLYGTSEPNMPVRYEFNSPPGILSPDPGPDGVYQLTKFCTAPSLTKFADKDYRKVATVPIRASIHLEYTGDPPKQ
ncbi:MAG: energy transducer TonB [Terracidiphilus sp.]